MTTSACRSTQMPDTHINRTPQTTAYPPRPIPSLWTMGGALLSAGVAYALCLLMHYLLIGYCGMALYGDVIFAYQALMVTGALLTMGTKHLVKNHLRAYPSPDTHTHNHFLWWHAGFLTQCLLLFSIVYALLVMSFAFADHVGALQLDRFHIAFWTPISAPFFAISMMVTVYFRAFGHAFAYHFFGHTFVNLLWIAMTLAWARLFPLPDTWDMVLFMVAQSFIAFLIIIVSALFILRDQLRTLIHFKAPLEIRPDWAQGRFSTLMIDLYAQLPVTIVLFCAEIAGSSESLVGVLSLSMGLSSILMLASQAIYHSIYPHLDSLIQSKWRDTTARKALVFANRMTLSLSVILLMVFILNGHSLLAYFGAHGPSTYGLFTGMLVATTIRSFHRPLKHLVITSHEETRRTGMLNLLFYLVLLIGGLMMTSYVGALGLVISYGIFSACQLGYLHTQCYRQYRHAVFALR
jgi:hypothetical protein